MLQTIDRIFGALARLFDAVSVVCLVLMTLLVNTEIVLRTFFNKSTLIADEYSGYLFCWMVLLGLLAVARDDRMLKVEYGLNVMPARTRAVAIIFASMVGLVAAIAFGYSGYLLASVSRQFGSITTISLTPVWIPQAVLPVAFGVLALFYAFDLVRRTIRLLNGDLS